MRLPGWLDPWWHLDFDVTTDLGPARAAAALVPGSGRMRGRKALDGSVIVVRRGGLVNQFVQARVTIASVVHVRIERPRFTKVFFVFAFVFVVIGQLAQVILAAAFDRPRLLGSALFLAYGAFIWVVVVAGTYTSARSEARDLQGLITNALRGAR